MNGFMDVTKLWDCTKMSDVWSAKYIIEEEEVEEGNNNNNKTSWESSRLQGELF